MQTGGVGHKALSCLLGLLGPLAVCLVLVPARASLSNAAGALVLIGVVAASASAGSRLAGVLASLSSALWFDFFLTRPYETLDITARANVETTIAIVLVGLGVTEIAVRARERYAVAAAEGDLLACLRDVSDLVASGREREEVLEAVALALCDVLVLEACRFEEGPLDPGRPCLARTGEVELGETRFPVAHEGLPKGPVELPVLARGVPAGHFVMTPRPGIPSPIERRVAAITLADEAGGVLGAPERAAT